MVMNREAWRAAVHEIKKSDMTEWLNNNRQWGKVDYRHFPDKET